MDIIILCRKVSQNPQFTLQIKQHNSAAGKARQGLRQSTIQNKLNNISLLYTHNNTSRVLTIVHCHVRHLSRDPHPSIHWATYCSEKARAWFGRPNTHTHSQDSSTKGKTTTRCGKHISSRLRFSRPLRVIQTRVRVCVCTWAF